MEENNQEVENIEEIPVVEGNDTIKIANEAVATYAGIAISDVPGVYGMAGGFAGGITEALSGKKNLSKGIKVTYFDIKNVDTDDNTKKLLV